MADFFIPPGYPNILVVYGTDVYVQTTTGEYDKVASRYLLYNYLRSQPPECPVTAYSHDFWMTHIPNFAGGDYDWSTAEHGPAGTFRGIIRTGRGLTPLDIDGASLYYRVALEEIGHYWLVPKDITFGGRVVSRSELFQEAFMSGTNFPPLQLLGRDNEHWSAHIESFPSPMDGVNWVEEEELTIEGPHEDPHVLRRYSPALPSPTLTLDDFGDIACPHYPDLDKVVMGMMSKEEAYPSGNSSNNPNANCIFELIPQWAAPVNFFGGMILVFSPTDVVIFGFSRGFNAIGITRTGFNYYERWDLTSLYKPWEFDSRIAFRIIRRDEEYYFQARHEIGNIGCLGSIAQRLGLYTPPSPIDPYEGWQDPTPPMDNPDGLLSWTTLKVIQSATPPRGVGYGSKSWFPDGWVDINFRPLRMKDDSRELAPIRTDPSSMTTITDSSYLSSLNTQRFVFHRPTANPRLRGNDVSCNLTVNGDADNRLNVDQMPKLLAMCPDRNFVAAGSIRIDRCCLAPWALGAYTAVQLWAKRNKIRVSDIGLSPASAANRQNPGRSYKGAYIIVAPRREDVTDVMIESVDRVRRGMEPVFSYATGGRRTFNTAL
jgi:hypothetical protein